MRYKKVEAKSKYLKGGRTYDAAVIPLSNVTMLLGSIVNVYCQRARVIKETELGRLVVTKGKEYAG